MKVEQQFELFRDMYLKALTEPVSFDGGKTQKSRGSHPSWWPGIPTVQRKINLADHKVWVWSDLHFGHKNIIEYSERPYPDVLTMNEHLVRNFNDYVGPDDVSVWVGDVAFLPDEVANRYVRRCNGKKILVVGNHDFYKGALKKLTSFDEIHIVYPYEVDGVSLIFTHYPLPTVPAKWINVHGHEHIARVMSAGRTTHINVNCEFHQYKPIAFEDIVTWAKGRIASVDAADWSKHWEAPLE